MFNLEPTLLLTRVITLVIAFTVHEFAHAWTADQLGDDTPRLAGRLSLNPLVHLDLIGSLMLVFAGFGWAKPVPINPYVLQRRTSAGIMIVAAAGPISNMGLAILASLPIQMGLVDVSPGFVQALLIDFIFLNLILFFFNLIPIFPLDGEKVLNHFLPAGGQALLAQIRPYGPVLLVAIIVLSSRAGLNLLGVLVQAPALNVLQLLVT
ncbi:MAG TPA: site-2 protease family protein [Anaerolineales bacterium]|nr:site-2 protease family protein [Anaerolineales bacterium]